MSSPTDSTPAYMNKEYWLAYGAIDWKSSTDEDISAAADRIVHQLPAGIGYTLNILDLGLGIGILELPLLAQIQKQLKCNVCLVGIDKSWKALEVTRRLLEDRGLAEGLPATTAEFLDCIERYWPNDNECTWPVDRRTNAEPGTMLRFSSGEGLSSVYGKVTYLLIQTDLDFLDLNSERGESVRTCVGKAGQHLTEKSASAWRSLPSNWFADLNTLLKGAALQSSGIVAGGRFDVLVASLSLMHMKWWRRTLWQGLRFLKNDGLFLHSKLGRDELIFEGAGAPIDRATCAAEAVFAELFSQADVKAFTRNAPRYYTATAPTELYEFMSHITGDERESGQSAARYQARNAIKKKYYSALLGTAGYSILHSIRRRMKSVYEDVLARLHAKYLTNQEEYDSRELESDIIWDAFRIRQPGELLRWKEIFAEYVPPGNKTKAARDVSLRVSRDYYQLHTASRWGLSWDLASSAVPGADNRGYALARVLETAGLLHPETIGGDLSLKTPSGGLKFEAFINPHQLVRIADKNPCKRAINFLASMQQYILRLQQRPYSNTAALVETFHPMLGLPCVLTFRRAMKPDLEIMRRTGFHEIRVAIESQNTQLHVASLGRLMQQNAAHAYESWNISPPFTFPLGNDEQNRAQSDLGALKSPMEMDDLDARAGRLLKSWGAAIYQPTLPDRHTEALRRFLEEDGVDFARAAACLSDISEWKTWVVFPCWFTGEDESMTAEESILIAYSSELTERELANEYEKFRVLFSKPGMSRAFKSGENEAFRDLREIFGHEVSKVYLGALLAMEGVSGEITPNQHLFISRATEAALRYGLIWAQSSDLIRVPPHACPAGNLWSVFAYAIAQLSWQTFLGAEVIRVDGDTIVADEALVQRVNALWSTDLTRVFRSEGAYQFGVGIRGPAGQTLDNISFVNDFLTWFMAALTNAWKHVVLDGRQQADGPLTLQHRLDAAERFISEAHDAELILSAHSKGLCNVFELRNKYVATADLSPSREHKTGLSLRLVSTSLRRFWGDASPTADRFEGIAGDRCWYTTLCLHGDILETL